MKAFFDTNVLVYVVSSDPRKSRAQALLRDRGFISAQVLSEFTNVARNKMRHGWAEIASALEQFLIALEPVIPLTLATHAAALGLARDHSVAFYDALIVASALEAGCDTLFTEDMQDGRAFGKLTLRNPFRGQ